MKENQPLPGWTISKEILDDGSFNVTISDARGHVTSVNGPDTIETSQACIAAAFEIERKHHENWKEFLYNLSVNLLIRKNVLHTEFNNDNRWFLVY